MQRAVANPRQFRVSMPSLHHSRYWPFSCFQADCPHVHTQLQCMLMAMAKSPGVLSPYRVDPAQKPEHMAGYGACIIQRYVCVRIHENDMCPGLHCALPLKHRLAVLLRKPSQRQWIGLLPSGFYIIIMYTLYIQRYYTQYMYTVHHCGWQMTC